MNKSATTRSGEETIALGKEIAVTLRPPLIVHLLGDLGAGKTTFAKGLISGLGAAREEEVTSPTFTLVHEFKNATSGLHVFHVDLYRVTDFRDFASLGLEDIFVEPAILIVEWAEKLSLHTDWPVLQIRLAHAPDDTRQIEIESLISTTSA
ncbi:MAG: tRNA (adenosine(37)-N6)-threonylcarbamoyltransferase complex ATPase subunit type 1 TsaE [Acidobacteria bacterium]|nr:tRNA (adenosine(37)-N6)-threonylcarbamoyltransferase complex ATPase subunit type 1 TsaE [Acidobacteriota bacterium]